MLKSKNLYFWFIRNSPEYSEINFEGIHISFMDELIPEQLIPNKIQSFLEGVSPEADCPEKSQTNKFPVKYHEPTLESPPVK